MHRTRISRLQKSHAKAILRTFKNEGLIFKQEGTSFEVWCDAHFSGLERVDGAWRLDNC